MRTITAARRLPLGSLGPSSRLRLPPMPPCAVMGKAASSSDYATTASFNSRTGRFESTGTESYFQRIGIPTDRAGRQMAHFFNIDDLEENRRQAQDIKRKLLKTVNWSVEGPKRKEAKRRQRNAWLLQD